jgi:hypothetical protein
MKRIVPKKKKSFTRNSSFEMKEEIENFKFEDDEP